jgi:hypothetical protein
MSVYRTAILSWDTVFMILGDLDIDRAETDPSYLAEVFRFLKSQPPRRRPGYGRSNQIDNQRRISAAGRRNHVTTLAGPAALG